jgi:truncated hemoglobin YjbI
LEELVAKQVDFSLSFLELEKKTYKGLPLKEAHKSFFINNAHFSRRQVLLKETLEEHGIDEETQALWLKREESLRPLILSK